MKLRLGVFLLLIMTTCVFASGSGLWPHGIVSLVGLGESASLDNIFVVDTNGNVFGETIDNSFESDQWQPILASGQLDSAITAIMGYEGAVMMGTKNGTVYAYQESSQEPVLAYSGVAPVVQFFANNGMNFAYSNGLVIHESNVPESSNADTLCAANSGYLFKSFAITNYNSNIISALASDISGTTFLLQCSGGSWTVIKNTKGLVMKSITRSYQTDGSDVLVGTNNSYVYTAIESQNRFTLLGTYSGYGLDGTAVNTLHDTTGYVLAGTKYGLIWPYTDSDGMSATWSNAFYLVPNSLPKTGINYIDAIKSSTHSDLYECEFSGSGLMSLVYCSSTGSNYWYPVYVYATQ